jgi:tetratricopeptide (TPR) repeat protein
MSLRILVATSFAIALAGHLVAQAPLAPPTAPAQSDELDVAAQMIKDGRFDDALKKIEEACKKNPALSPPKLILARMVYQIMPSQARPFLEAAATETPNHPDVYLTLGDIAQHEGRYSEAILNATKALELINTSSLAPPQKTNAQKSARIILTSSYEHRRDWNNARAQLLAWLELDPKNGFARERYASVLFALDKVDEAYKEYQAAAKDDPTRLPADVQMGRQFAARGDDARATQYFEKAVQSAANDVRAKIAYADYLLQRGKVDAAKLHLEVASKLEPQNPLVKQMNGLVARLAKDYATAERIFQELYTASPANVNASNQLALILAESSDPASRKRGLEIAELNVRQFGQSPDLLATLAYSYFRNGNPNEAKKILGAILGAVRVPPPDTTYFMALVLIDDPSAIDDAKALLRASLDSKSMSFYRKEAQALYDRLEKAKPTEKAKG